MRLLLGIIGVGALLVLALVGWLYFKAFRGGKRAYLSALREIEPVLDALRSGRLPETPDLLRFAQDRRTRKVLFDTLAEAKRLDLFPSQYWTWEALTESDLVLWLAHPNQLGSPPDEIDLWLEFQRRPMFCPIRQNTLCFVFGCGLRIGMPRTTGWLASPGPT